MAVVFASRILTTAPPLIPPVASGASRPRWSVMVPTYNCAGLLAATLESVVRQAPDAEDMEIVVVDDCSEDDVAGVVAAFGDRVRLHRQPRNLGVPGNLTDCILQSRGHLVHILHGDDQVRPGFYQAMERGFAQDAVGVVWCRQIFMDPAGDWIGVSPIEAPEGLIENPALFLARRQRIMTPSICVRRSAYEQVGGFHPELRLVEDWEMWVRLASRFAVWHLREPLAVYRLHDGSNTGRSLKDAAEVAAAGRAITLFCRHLPEIERAAVGAEARAAVARRALDTGYALARAGRRGAAMAQYRAAARLCPSPEILARGLYNAARLLG